MSERQRKTYEMTELQLVMADAILDELSRQGMSQRQLAEKAFLSESGVNAILIGAKTGYLFSWQAMFDALGIKFKFWTGDER